MFEELADLEEIEGNRWGAIAYRKVSASILKLTEDISAYGRRGELRTIDGVGTAIEKKILQYLESGQIEKLDEMKKKYPVDFSGLRKVQGLGSKTIAALYNSLGVRNIEDLRKAIESHQISSLKGFTEKTEEKLRRGLEIVSASAGRLLLANTFDYIQEMAENLRKSGFFQKVTVAGSTRRMKETIGDVDILVTSDVPSSGIDYFLSLKNVREIIVRGESKVTVSLDIGITCDLRIIDAESYGAALQYFTGSKEHNIRMRDIAIQKGLKLNEYGLFRGNESIAAGEEDQVYQALGLQPVPPELRENSGEIEAAIEGKLPGLLELSDIKGDFHTHTNRTDGFGTLDDLYAQARLMRLEYVIITDHSKSLPVAKGLDSKRFHDLFNDIDMFNRKAEGFMFLKGIEMEILRDGSLDMDRGTLSKMDFVMAAMHQWASSDMEENTSRIVKAVESGQIDVLAHPTGRLIGTREPYRIDFDSVFQACRDSSVALEINGFAERSDLPSDLVMRAREYGLKFSLGSDTHKPEQMKYLKFACSIARRGWLGKNDILNVRSPEELKKFRHF